MLSLRSLLSGKSNKSNKSKFRQSYPATARKMPAAAQTGLCYVKFWPKSFSTTEKRYIRISSGAKGLDFPFYGAILLYTYL